MCIHFVYLFVIFGNDQSNIYVPKIEYIAFETVNHTYIFNFYVKNCLNGIKFSAYIMNNYLKHD